MSKINPAACRAARALLGLSQRDLAAGAKVSPNNVNAFEKGETIPLASIDRLGAYFEASGVQVWNDDRPGARMKPKA